MRAFTTRAAVPIRPMLRIVPVAALFLALGCQDVERTLGPQQPPIELARTGPGPSDQIVFQGDRNGRTDVFSMHADGRNVTRLTSQGESNMHPVWSRDGKWIAFSRDIGGFAGEEIFIMRADGSSQRRITDRPGQNSYPTWSPDGRRIAFVSNGDGDNELYVIDVDGTDATGGVGTRLTTRAGWDNRPAWSPDGARIAFESDRDGAIQLYVMNTDGNGVVRLTNNAAFDGEPAWSPDGLKIAFHSTRAGNQDIYVMNADGTNERRLTDDPAYDYTPAWSPDGGRIAFTSNRPDPNGFSTGIFVMRADGSRVSKLSSVMADAEPSWR
jgi:Tol biopolymer transport system component